MKKHEFRNRTLLHMKNFGSFKFEYKIDPHCSGLIVSLGRLEYETVTMYRKYQGDDIQCKENEVKTIFVFTECCGYSETHCPECNRCLCSGCRFDDCWGPDSVHKFEK